MWWTLLLLLLLLWYCSSGDDSSSCASGSSFDGDSIVKQQLFPFSVNDPLLLDYINADLSPDLKRDCFIVSVNQFLECTCTGDVPPVIKVDLAEAKKGLFNDLSFYVVVFLTSRIYVCMYVRMV